MLKDKYIIEISEADVEVCENADSFLQSAMWAEFKSRFGWKTRTFLIDWSDYAGQKTPLLLLSRRLAPGFTFAYVPWGPQLPADFPAVSRAQALSQLAKKLKPFLARNTVFLRFEPPWFYIEGGEVVLPDEDKQLSSSGFKRASATVQPPDTVHISLVESCEQILAAMKPKWRYNISLAAKKGVRVKKEGAREIEIFYSLLKETAARDGIAVHNIDYYRGLFEVCDQKNEGKLSLRLYTANHEGDTLAAIVVLFMGKAATYLYGASSNNKRNLMAPYALQWTAMQDAKEAGCLYYDLFGIPPNEDPNHPMAGLFRFKTGFGGRIIHRPGTWDYPYKSAVYGLFSVVEAFRKKLLDRKKNRG